MLSDFLGLLRALSARGPGDRPLPLRVSQVLEFVYWARLLGALACGVVCGALGLTGYLPFLALAAAFLLPYRVVVRRTDAPLEGVLWCNWAGAASAFLAPWVLLYSVFHT